MISIEQAAGQRLLIAFEGMDGPSDDFLHALRQYQPAGLTLFRAKNIRNPRQVRALTAAQSNPLVRERASLLPLRLSETQRLAVVLPMPLDLTPVDTSSYVAPSLAQAVRAYHPRTEEIIVPHAPDKEDISEILERISSTDRIVLGTLNAFAQPGQAALARAILESGIPTIIVALRMPYDLSEFPQAPTYLCSYSILEPSMCALVRVLFGQSPARGRLPVSIPGLYPIGHGNKSS